MPWLINKMPQILLCSVPPFQYDCYFSHQEVEPTFHIWMWVDFLIHWRRKWQPTPVFMPGESQGRGSLVGCRLWGRTESDTTEVT